MEAKPVFDAFYSDLQNTFFENLPNSEEDEDTTVKHIETTYYPALLKIIQRDDSFFDEERTFRGINISKLWKENESNREAIWKHVFMCVLTSFFHGDFKQKIGIVINALKSMWNGSGQENDELSQILNDEHSEDHFKEILEFLQETRLAKIFMDIVEQVDVSEIDLNFDNPQELVETLRNPEHPKMKKIITKIQGLIQEKMQRGEISQQQLIGEIESIKLKIQRVFGNVVNNMLGLNTNNRDREAGPRFANTPEGRRQQRIHKLQQRLQKRYMEEEKKNNNLQ